MYNEMLLVLSTECQCKLVIGKSFIADVLSVSFLRLL